MHTRNETSCTISPTEVQPTQTQLLIQDSSADGSGIEMIMMQDQAQGSPHRMQIIIEDHQEDFTSDVKDKKRRDLPRSPTLRRKGAAQFSYESNKVHAEERLFTRVQRNQYNSEQVGYHISSELKTKTPE